MCELFSFAKFSLHNGDELLLSSVFQRHTYETVLMGGPHPKCIPLYESWYPGEVSRIFHYLEGPTVLIDPQMVANDANEPVLPDITCFGQFWSSGVIVAEQKQFHYLYVIWFETVGDGYMSADNVAKLKRRGWRTIAVPLTEPNQDNW